MDQPEIGEEIQHVHVTTPLGSRAKLTRHTFTTLDETADLLSPMKPGDL